MKQVQTAYGEGSITALRAGGEVFEVAFPQGQWGSFVFPYGGKALLRRHVCKRVSQVEGLAWWITSASNLRRRIDDTLISTA